MVFFVCLQTVHAAYGLWAFGCSFLVKCSLIVVRFWRCSTCSCVTTSPARSVRSFFSKRDRASTRPFVDARGPVRDVRARAQYRPTPIMSIRSSCGTPRRSTISFTPGHSGQVQGTHRAGRDPQGFACRKGSESTQSQKPKGFPPRGCYISGTWAEDRATVGTDPSAAPGLEEE
jgi:hypothetical protein